LEYHSTFIHHSPRVHFDLHSFPTRRSSDLLVYWGTCHKTWISSRFLHRYKCGGPYFILIISHSKPKQTKPIKKDSAIIYWFRLLDRKSTRLNSSHVSISYAVFCLKKKTIKY